MQWTFYLCILCHILGFCPDQVPADKVMKCYHCEGTEDCGKFPIKSTTGPGCLTCLAETLCQASAELLQRLHAAQANTAAAIAKLKTADVSNPPTSLNNNVISHLPQQKNYNVKGEMINGDSDYEEEEHKTFSIQDLLKQESNLRPSKRRPSSPFSSREWGDPRLDVTPEKFLPPVEDDASLSLKAKGLLGYDWIAGMMDNRTSATLLHNPDEYFSELQKFRLQHKEDCIAEKFRHEAYNLAEQVVKPLLGSVGDELEAAQRRKALEDTPIAYTVNERLVPVPVEPLLPMETTSQPSGPDRTGQRILKVSIPLARLRHIPPQLSALSPRGTPTLGCPPPPLRQPPSTADSHTASIWSHCRPSTDPYARLPHKAHFVKEATSLHATTKDTALEDERKTSFKNDPPQCKPPTASLLSAVQHEQRQHSHLFEWQPKTEAEAVALLRRGRCATSSSSVVLAGLPTKDREEMDLMERSVMIPITVGSRSAIKAGHEAIQQLERRPRCGSSLQNELLDTCKRIRGAKSPVTVTTSSKSSRTNSARRSVRFKEEE